ncbi:MAG: hypothetical protein U0230_03485 [Polyangiales bacterium]
MTRLQQMLDTSRPDMAAIRDFLDGLDPATRKHEALSLRVGQQRRLFEAARGFKALTLEDMVPSNVPSMKEVVHSGRNTLPIPGASHFAKVCVRPDGAERDSGEIWGYNRNSLLLEQAVGPGYYVLHQHAAPGELLVNYLRVPPRAPAHWPKILDNSERLSFFVYNGTQDVLRGVSKHVTIGRAQKNGQWLPAWFILCRED